MGETGSQEEKSCRDDPNVLLRPETMMTVMRKRKMKGARAKEKYWLAVLIAALVLMTFYPAWGRPASAVVGAVGDHGVIHVNDVVSPAGTLVYAGNRISTGSRTVGYIALAHGGKLVLDEASSAQITESRDGVNVRLDHGVVSIVGVAKAPIIVTTKGVAIHGKHAAGVFEVSLKGNQLKVLAVHGLSVAEAANRMVEIPEGIIMIAEVSPGTSASEEGKLMLGRLVSAGDTELYSHGISSHEQNNVQQHTNCVSPSNLDCH